MIAHAREDRESVFSDRIDILNVWGVEPSPAGRVFRTVAAILALVRVGAPVLSALDLSLTVRPEQDD